MSEDGDGLDLERCANCGAPLAVPEQGYPKTTRRLEEGLELFAFCDAACRERFLGGE